MKRNYVRRGTINLTFAHIATSHYQDFLVFPFLAKLKPQPVEKKKENQHSVFIKLLNISKKLKVFLPSMN